MSRISVNGGTRHDNQGEGIKSSFGLCLPNDCDRISLAKRNDFKIIKRG